ncbi:hypothetical protein GJ496_001121 [Pomphorhynchus laevis]|nr:hypothetical protein GJ496_001121 [Pomphorhynchus laevis]
MNESNDQDYGNDSKLFSSENPENIYTDLIEIGHGHFGCVYYARDNRSNEVVALKKVPWASDRNDEKWHDIFREVQFLSKLQHQYCVGYKGCFLYNDYIWLAMEYCLGSAWDLLTVQKKPLQENEIATIISSILNALEYIHSLRWIHRDVKAANILLTEDGIAKLGDFGSASFSCPTNSFLGTPYWMAPEVILAMDEAEYDYRVDIWSLGVTCLEMAEMKPPYFNMNAMSALYHIAQKREPRLKNPDQWSSQFDNFISMCLQRNPSDRLSSEQLLMHEFIVSNFDNVALTILIRKVKSLVREQDNLHRTKMKKLLLVDDHESTSSPSLIDDIGCESSLNNEGSELTFDNGDALVLTSESTDDLKHHFKMSYDFSRLNPFSNENPDSERTRSNSGSLISFSSFGFGSTSHVRFPTIRPAKFRHRKRDMESIEKFGYYRLLRKQHHKKLRSLEDKCIEIEQECIDRSTRIQDSQASRFEGELAKLVEKHRKERNEWVKYLDSKENKHMKEKQEQLDLELKKFIREQERLYKMQKESYKRDISSIKSSSNKEELLKTYKEKLKSRIKQERKDKSTNHEHQIALYRCQLSRRRLRHLQDIEINHCKEEIAEEDEHFRQLELLKRKNLETLIEIQRKHLIKCQELRQDLLKKQEQSELQNQQEYMQYKLKSAEKSFQIALKNVPRESQIERTNLKRVYKDKCSNEMDQFRLLKDNLRMRAIDKRYSFNDSFDQQTIQDFHSNLENEKSTKLKQLREDYKKQAGVVEDNLKRKAVDIHNEELRCLRKRLDDELTILLDAQRVNRQRLSEQMKEQKLLLEQQIAEAHILLQANIDRDSHLLNDKHASRFFCIQSEYKEVLDSLEKEIRKLNISDVDEVLSEAMASAHLSVLQT